MYLKICLVDVSSYFKNGESNNQDFLFIQEVVMVHTQGVVEETTGVLIKLVTMTTGTKHCLELKNLEKWQIICNSII